MSSSGSHTHFFQSNDPQQIDSAQTPLEKMTAAFGQKHREAAHEYCELLLKEVKLDREYINDNNPRVKAAINKKEDIARIFLDDLYQRNYIDEISLEVADIYKTEDVIISSSESHTHFFEPNDHQQIGVVHRNPHIHFFQLSGYEQTDSPQTPLEKMTEAFEQKNYEAAHEYCKLVLEEVTLDREYSNDAKAAIDEKKAIALTLLGDLYRKGRTDETPLNPDHAGKLYLNAIEELNYSAACSHLMKLKR